MCVCGGGGERVIITHTRAEGYSIKASPGPEKTSVVYNNDFGSNMEECGCVPYTTAANLYTYTPLFTH